MQFVLLYGNFIFLFHLNANIFVYCKQKPATKFYSTAAVMHYYDSIERSKKVLLATASRSSLCVLWRRVISAPQLLKLPAPAHSWVTLRSAAAALPSSLRLPPQAAISHPASILVYPQLKLHNCFLLLQLLLNKYKDCSTTQFTTHRSWVSIKSNCNTAVGFLLFLPQNSPNFVQF